MSDDNDRMEDDNDGTGIDYNLLSQFIDQDVPMVDDPDGALEVIREVNDSGEGRDNQSIDESSIPQVDTIDEMDEVADVQFQDVDDDENDGVNDLQEVELIEDEEPLQQVDQIEDDEPVEEVDQIEDEEPVEEVNQIEEFESLDQPELEANENIDEIDGITGETKQVTPVESNDPVSQPVDANQVDQELEPINLNPESGESHQQSMETTLLDRNNELAGLSDQENEQHNLIDQENIENIQEVESGSNAESSDQENSEKSNTELKDKESIEKSNADLIDQHNADHKPYSGSEAQVELIDQENQDTSPSEHMLIEDEVDKPEPSDQTSLKSNQLSNQSRSTSIDENSIIEFDQDKQKVQNSNDREHLIENSNDQDHHPDETASSINPNETLTSINPNVTFATPSKSLPSLKDIDSIVTPKSFQVARDIEPIIPEELLNNLPSQEQLQIAAGFLQINQNLLNDLDPTIIKQLIAKSKIISSLQSENSFTKLQLEQLQTNHKKTIADLKLKLNQVNEKNQQQDALNQDLTTKSANQSSLINQLKDSNNILQSRLDNLKTSNEEITNSFDKFKQDHHHELSQLQSTISKLQLENINQIAQINELTKELNDSKSSQFNLKLELIKTSNAQTYLQNQKSWYEEELNNSQTKYTELLKKHDSEHLVLSNKLSSITSKFESIKNSNQELKSTNEQLKIRLEQEISKATNSNSDYTSEKSKLLNELKGKEELLELTKRQSNQRAERIEQLENYAQEIKQKLGNSIESLEETIELKTEKIVELEEKLKRLEEVLDAELHKETDLPKLANSSTLIAAEGISLSSLYSEFTHIKKQLVLERSQKEKLALQLETFVEELEARKPAIANYREQIDYYERTVEQMIGRIEAIRIEKLEAEKDANRLKSRFVNKENELVSMKKLLRDLGRQLCYYLIHSNIRDNNQDPLSNVEKKAIEAILEKSGNFENHQDSDSDNLISERLVEFKSIIELKQRNEELLVAIRQLSKRLEMREEESNDLESIAVEEAKDAILTLQGELDSLTIKYEAVSQERDSLKSISRMNGGSSSSEVKFLTDANADLKAKLSESEKFLRDLQKQSKEYADELNNKLQEATKTNNEISIQLAQVKNAAKLAETRLQNNEDTLKGRNVELESLKKEILFWRNQAEKQEKILVEKSNELREAESNLNKNKVLFSSLNSEKQYNSELIDTLKQQIEKLTTDKNNLNEYVLNLQSLLKDRESANKELSENLAENTKNYQSLQQKLQEREDRAAVIASQTDLALKAQNAKLEQVNEISQQLLDTKTALAEKELVIAQLTHKVKELEATRKRASMVAATSGTTSGTGDRLEVDSLKIEIDQFKADIRNLESNNAELINLLQAAESALMSSTESNTEYKKTAEAKINELTSKKESLEQELESTTKALHESKAELNKLVELNTEECNKLRSELQSVIGKATEFDNMKNDYETRLSHLEKDLRSQVQVSNSNQMKYEAELQKNQESLEAISKQRDQIEELKANVDDLNSKLEKAKLDQESKFDSIVGERSSIEEEYQATTLRLKELEEQNSLLLNQLELSKSDLNNESGQDLREVIRYLRREKENIEAKAMASEEQKRELQARLTQISSELKIARSEVSFVQSNYVNLNDGERERKLLTEQLEQLNILRESNTTLRNEANQRLQKIEELEGKVQELQSKIAPLTDQINELTTNLELANQKVNLLEEEKVILKSRSTPAAGEESASLIAARERLNTVREQANTKIKSQNAVIESLNSSIKNLQEEIVKLNKSRTEDAVKAKAELQKKVEELNQTINSTKEQVKKLEKDKAVLSQQSAKAEGANSNLKLNELKDSFEKQKLELRKFLQSEYDTKLKSELRKVEASNATTIRKDIQEEYETKIKELEQSFELSKANLEKDLKALYEEKLKQQAAQDGKDTLQNDLVKLRADLNSQHEAEIKKLNDDFKNKLDKEVAKAKSQVEKLFEVKIKMLNKKLERFTSNNKPASIPAVPKTSGFGPNNNTFGFGAQANASTGPTKTNVAANDGQKARPKGAPFNENTLTVHRPQQTESTLTVHMPNPEANKKQNKNANSNDKKRPFSQQSSNNHQSKKPKE